MAGKMKYVLAVDLGTSGPKTALISIHGDVVTDAFEETPVILLPGGGAEQDPEGWWKAIMSTARQVLARRLVPVDDIIAVSVTTQWSGTVPVDENGHHLMNAVIWIDSRGAEPLKEKESYHRQERNHGHFTRTLQLPFHRWIPELHGPLGPLPPVA